MDTLSLNISAQVQVTDIIKIIILDNQFMVL